MELLLEYMSDDARRQVSCAEFKSWLRGGIAQFGAVVDSDDDEREPSSEAATWSGAFRLTMPTGAPHPLDKARRRP